MGGGAMARSSAVAGATLLALAVVQGFAWVCWPGAGGWLPLACAAVGFVVALALHLRGVAEGRR